MTGLIFNMTCLDELVHLVYSERLYLSYCIALCRVFLFFGGRVWE